MNTDQEIQEMIMSIRGTGFSNQTREDNIVNLLKQVGRRINFKDLGVGTDPEQWSEDDQQAIFDELEEIQVAGLDEQYLDEMGHYD